MKIVHVVEPFSSGVVTSIIQICRELDEFDHTVIHGMRTSQDAMLKVRKRFPDSVNFIIWKSAVREIRIFKDVLALFELYRILKTIKPDVVHLHSSKAGGLGRIAAKLIGVNNIIYSPHSAPFLRKDTKTLTNRFYILIEKVLAKLANRIVCCGESEVMEFEKLGISATYINNGVVPSQKFTPKAQNEVLTVGCAAIITAQKNPAMFNNIATYFKNDKRLKFLWIGDGELREELEASNISITGWKNNEETKRFIESVDIYLSTSLWEGLPYAVIEAMDMSTCLVLHNCVGNVDLVREGENGYIFSTLDEAIRKINYLLENPNLIVSMGKASKILCNNEFTAEQMGVNFKYVYTKKI